MARIKRTKITSISHELMLGSTDILNMLSGNVGKFEGPVRVTFAVPGNFPLREIDLDDDQCVIKVRWETCTREEDDG